MKKIMLIPALMLSVSLMADNEKYEVTPVIGYNFVQDNLDLDDARLYGAEFQYNGFNSVIKPEFSVLYSDVDYEYTNLDTNIYRFALNGVYEYNKIGAFTPMGKLGIGYETISDTYGTQNADGAFLDAGLGTKIDLTKNFALKLEVVWMLKDGVSGTDNNLATLVGLNYSFGGTKPEPIVVEEVVEEVVIIDGDDDMDGVLNSVDECPNSLPGDIVDAKGCKLDNDSDRDGVLNSVDKCPNTPANQVVDQTGCMLLVDLTANFKTNSYDLDDASQINLNKFTNFLELKPNYNAKITGYTDSRGKASYNKKLSKERADAVKAELVKRGVKADRIKTVGMGEENPVATNSTKEGRAKNRRVEAILIKN